MTNTSKPVPTPIVDRTTQEMLESLTGYEELMIKKHFGDRVQTFIVEGDVFTYGRALVFAHRKREGDTELAAFEAAMSMSIKNVTDYFAEDPEGDGDEVDAALEGLISAEDLTPVGEDDSPSA